MITLEEAKKLAQGYQVVPISMEILSDSKTPIEVLRILRIRKSGDVIPFWVTIPVWKLPVPMVI